MEDDVKTRFDDVDKRLAGTEKRIDDVKWFIGGYTGVFTIIFGLLSLMGNYNFNTEKTLIHEDLQDFKTELLGQAQKVPQIDLFADDGLPLVNHEVNVAFRKDEKNALQLWVQLIFKNSGEALSGPMYIKIYTTDPIQMSNKSTDEPKFQYEAYFSPENLHTPQLPGKFSFEEHLHVTLLNEKQPPPGKYPALLKVFYGQGQVAQAGFIMVATGS
jgi:hypothetical protein